MNAMTRLSRTIAVSLSLALLNGAFAPEALAHVVGRVPVTNAPVGAPIVAPGISGVQTNVLTLTAPNLGLTAATPGLSAAPVLSAPAALQAPAAAAAAHDAPAAGQTAALSLSAAKTVAVPVAAPAEAPAADAEFKAEDGAERVASGSRIGRGFAALRAAFSNRSPETLTAPSAARGAVAADAAGSARSAAALAPSSVLAAANDGKETPPAPDAPSTPGAPKDGKPVSSGLGMAAWAFIGALLIAQIGVEAMGTAMPQLVQAVFGDFTKVAQIAIFSSVTGIIGRQIAPVIIERYGLRKTYLATEVLRMVSISAMLGLLVTGHMGLVGMMFFYSMNGFFGGVALTAEQSIPAALLGQDEMKLRRFWNREQMILEFAGIIVPVVAGAAARPEALGTTAVLTAFPIAFALAFIVLFIFLRMPQKVELMREADLAKAKAAVRDAAAERKTAGSLRAGILTTAVVLAAAGAFAAYAASFIAAGAALAAAAGLGALAWRLSRRVKAETVTLGRAENIFGQFFARMARGAKLVWSDPTLRYGFMGFSVFMMLNPFLYSIIAPGFGLMVGGTSSMAAFAGTVVALYSVGGLLGSLYTDREQSRLEKQHEEGKLDKEQVSEALRKSMLKMMLLTIPTLLAFAVVFLPNPALLAAVSVPYPFGLEGYFIAPGTLTLFSLAVIPFGFAQVASVTMLRAYFQSKVPGPQHMADANGFMGSASLVISTIGLQSLSWLFQHTSGMMPFIVFAGAMVPLGLFFYYLARKLRAAGAAKPA